MAAPTSTPSPDVHLVLQSSHRLTPRLSLHTFSIPDTLDLGQPIRPSQHVTLQFPPALDPIAGARNLNEQDRRLDFTPCHFEYDSSGSLRSFSLLSGNGRVTGLLGLPRPQGPLTAQLVSIGKGFSEDVLENAETMCCIAGGTGMSPFLALASTPQWHESEKSSSSIFYWSIRGDDFDIVEHFLQNNVLKLDKWASIRIHVTAGEEAGGLPAGKTQAWWQTRFENLKERFSGNIQFHLERMIKDDVDSLVSSSKGTIFFCGSKSLEWQVKMWTLGEAVVQCTER